MAKPKKLQMIVQEAEAIKEQVIEAVEAVLEEVKLIGTEGEKTGKHLYMAAQYHVRFIDGVATVRKAIADELRKLGVVE